MSVISPNQVSLSHQHQASMITSTQLEQLRSRIQSHPQSSKLLALLDDLTQFELGRFLLQHRGLNAYWTSFLMRGYLQTHLRHPLEHWLVHEAPMVIATRERYHIFGEQLQQHVQSGMHIGSLPCGLFDEIHFLDPGRISTLALTGIDFDPVALSYAEAALNDLPWSLRTEQLDAWALQATDIFDVLICHGLNIYEANPKRLFDLYQRCFNALQPGGWLLTSYISEPPTVTKNSRWQVHCPEHLPQQQSLFQDLIAARWQTYMSMDAMTQLLHQVGFRHIQIIEDSQRIFPTVWAQKK
jgi:hypothetical protein